MKYSVTLILKKDFVLTNPSSPLIMDAFNSKYRHLGKVVGISNYRNGRSDNFLSAVEIKQSDPASGDVVITATVDTLLIEKDGDIHWLGALEGGA